MPLRPLVLLRHRLSCAVHIVCSLPELLLAVGACCHKRRTQTALASLYVGGCSCSDGNGTCAVYIRQLALVLRVKGFAALGMENKVWWLLRSAMAQQTACLAAALRLRSRKQSNARTHQHAHCTQRSTAVPDCPVHS